MIKKKIILIPVEVFVLISLLILAVFFIIFQVGPVPSTYLSGLLGDDNVTDIQNAATAEPIVLFYDDFESGINGWESTSLWHQEIKQSKSPTTSWTYNTGPPDYNYAIGKSSGSLTSPQIDLTGSSSALLTFYDFHDKGTLLDKRWVQISIDGGPFTNLIQLPEEFININIWNKHDIDLSAYIGKIIQIRFFFDTINQLGNLFWGWSIDDFTISGVLEKPNNQPVANAGPDQIIIDFDEDGKENVMLDGSASFDPDGTIISYEWGEGTIILGTTSVITKNLDVGIHTITLKVKDNEGKISTDDVSITIESLLNITSVASATNVSELDQIITDLEEGLITEGVDFVSDEVIIKFKKNRDITSLDLTEYDIQDYEKILSEDKRPALTKVLQLFFDTGSQQHLKYFEKQGVDRIYILKVEDIKKAIKDLGDDPNIEYVEPNYIVHTTLTPNDPNFSKLYGLHNTGQTGGIPDADIDAPEAWDTQTGSNTIIVAVIDTGVDYTHEDLADNMWVNVNEIPNNGIDDDNNGFVDDVRGWDFIGIGDNDPMDDHGHGTHCSGTIGAVGNNSVGVVGVNWNVKIMPLKFLGASGSGSISDAVSAVEYATLMNADIMSNSWGGGGFSQAMEDAIVAANDAGILFVAAAGNSNSNNDIFSHYPSNYDVPNVVAVAATDKFDNKASFSSYGATKVHLGAPGVSIYSTVPTGTCSLCDPSGYKFLSGTSMATPHVAGVAALIKLQFPGITPSEIKSRLLSSVDHLTSLEGKTVSEGRLNVFNSLEEDSIAPGIITDLTAIDKGSSSVILTWTATGDDGNIGTASLYDLRYSRFLIDDTNFDSANKASGLPKPQVSGSTEVFNVTGLLPLTTYYFAIKVVDNVGNKGAISNIASETTLQPPPPLTSLFDDFDPDTDMSQWTSISLGTASTSCGSVSGNALYFTGSGSREAITHHLNVIAGGPITFFLKIGTGSGSCENADFGENVVLEYSTDFGITWNIINTYDQDSYPNFTRITETIPVAAWSSSTKFRFRQVSHSNHGFDNWAIDNVSILVDNGTPPPIINNPPIADANGPYSGTEDISLTFNGSGSFDPDNDTLTYNWDFGDNSTGIGVTPSHIYTIKGTYTVILIVNDGQVDSTPDTTTATIITTCGNDIIEPNEQCDGTNLGDEDCESQGFDGGTLNCIAPGQPNECTFDTSGCFECVLTNAYWNTTSAIEGDNIPIIVEGNDCELFTVNFTVKESDLFGRDDDVEQNPGDGVFINGIARSSWIAEFQEDIINPPEYYFKATLISDPTTNITSNNLLTVGLSEDRDGDGTKDHNDCNDFNGIIGECQGCSVCSQDPRLDNNTGICIAPAINNCPDIRCPTLNICGFRSCKMGEIAVFPPTQETSCNVIRDFGACLPLRCDPIGCTSETGCLTDSDGDGIRDAQDQCPNQVFTDQNFFGYPLPIVTEFSRDLLSNLTLEDLENIRDFRLGIRNRASIVFENHTLRLYERQADTCSPLDFDSFINIGQGFVEINSENLSILNKSAVITFYNITFNNPRIFVDSRTCEECEIISYENKTLIVNVPHFSIIKIVGDTIYEVGEGASCGDNICDIEETCSSCSVDCGACPSGGGGGGGGRYYTTQQIDSFTEITPKTTKIITDFDEDIGIKEIRIEVNNEAQDVKITVSKYDSKPTTVSKEKSGKVYRYLEINTENLEDKLEKATITIQVEKTWVSDNDLEKEDIALFKFDEDFEVWNELSTIFTNEDDLFYFYDIEVDSFSYFAISSKIVEGEEIVGEQLPLVILIPLIISVIVVVGILLVIYLIRKRKRSKRKNFKSYPNLIRE